jgi:aerobic carbon-monoxide dehydrogenase large subunit
MNTTLIGQRISRSEDEALLRGEGLYVDDVSLPNALHGAFVRSPFAHARIVDVDVEQARACPGVSAVYTCDDLGPYDRPLPLIFSPEGTENPRTQRPLARDEVFYAGQPIAMILATSRAAAEDGAEQVIIQFEPLDVVVDLQSAVSNSQLVHSDTADNLAGLVTQRVGNPDAAFAEAAVTIRGRYALHRSAAMPMETRAVAADFDRRAKQLTVWDTTQVPSPVRRALALWFGVGEDDIRVIAPDTGGAFGVKAFFFYPEEFLVPWAARSLARPVKWTEDRVEHFTASHHERTQIHEIELAATRDGTIVALRDVFLHDTGAFIPYGLCVPKVAACQIAGPYRIPNISVELRAIYTHTVPVTPYRGCGRPQANFALERALAQLAAELDMDPVELRRRNFIGPSEFPYAREGLHTVDGNDVILDSGDYPRQLEILLDKLRLEEFREAQKGARKEGRYLGLGMAPYVEVTGFGPYEAVRLKVQALTGKIHLSCALADQGQGHKTTLAQIVASELGVSFDQVEVVEGDTAVFPWGVGAYASSSTVVTGNAIGTAVIQLKRKALELASGMLEADASDLEWNNGGVQVKGSPSTRVSLRHLAKAADPDDRYSFDPETDALATYQAPRDPDVEYRSEAERPGLEVVSSYSPSRANGRAWGSGIHAAVVEVDLETGFVRVVRYVAVHDCGVMVNPSLVEGQVIGGIAQGIAGALYERMVYGDDGQLENASFMDFLMPYATEIPRVELHHIETPSPNNPLGLKGVGEAGIIPAASVIAAAIEDAVFTGRLYIREMPIDPPTLLGLIDEMS